MHLRLRLSFRAPTWPLPAIEKVGQSNLIPAKWQRHMVCERHHGRHWLYHQKDNTGMTRLIRATQLSTMAQRCRPQLNAGHRVQLTSPNTTCPKCHPKHKLLASDCQIAKEFSPVVGRCIMMDITGKPGTWLRRSLCGFLVTSMTSEIQTPGLWISPTIHGWPAKTHPLNQDTLKVII